MEKLKSKEANPIYTIVNLDAYPVNPYREFVHYVGTTVYPTIEHKSKSLADFKNMTDSERIAFITEIESLVPGTKIVVKPASHKRIFLEFDYMLKDTVLCNMKFYTHLTYVSSGKNSEKELTAAEVDFSMNDFLDFLKINKNDNLFDFSKSENCSETMDMVIAMLYAFGNSTEFIKIFKAKSLTIKNIQLFADKLIRPWVSDMNILFTPDMFLVGTICGTEISKSEYSYDNYLESIKQYASEIKAKYGDKYKLENEAAEEARKKEDS